MLMMVMYSIKDFYQQSEEYKKYMEEHKEENDNE